MDEGHPDLRSLLSDLDDLSAAGRQAIMDELISELARLQESVVQPHQDD